jgi:hypothetical protein
MDSPYLGANVPLGIQYWFAFFSDIASQAAFFVDRLNRPAAREILIYHSKGTLAPVPACDPLRTQLLAEFAAMGNWPRVPRKVAIANGSGSGVGQGFAPGDPLLRYSYRAPFRAIDGNVWALRDSVAGVVFDGRVTVVIPIKRQTVAAMGAQPLDGAPGGWRATMLQMDTTAVPYGDVVAVHPNHCFVPTVSALALGVSRLDARIPSGAELRAITPFDTVYCPAENQGHVQVTAENAAWIEREIAGSAAITGVEAGADASVPDAAAFATLTPNPFRLATRIVFRIASPMDTRVTVFDLRGRAIAKLIDARLDAGEHVATWQGETADGRRAPPGVYFIRLETPGQTRTARITRLE